MFILAVFTTTNPACFKLPYGKEAGFRTRHCIGLRLCGIMHGPEEGRNEKTACENSGVKVNRKLEFFIDFMKNWHYIQINHLQENFNLCIIYKKICGIDIMHKILKKIVYYAEKEKKFFRLLFPRERSFLYRNYNE